MNVQRPHTLNAENTCHQYGNILVTPGRFLMIHYIYKLDNKNAFQNVHFAGLSVSQRLRGKTSLVFGLQ